MCIQLFLFFCTFNLPTQNNNTLADIDFEKIKDKKIYAVAPASQVTMQQLKDLKAIKGLSFIFSVDDHLDNLSLFHSATDTKRFQALKAAIDDPSIDIIWCLRGGYGSAKLIDQLMQLKPPKRQKIFIGYSDVTALHIFFSQKWGWQTIHGTTLLDLLKKDKSALNIQKLIDLLSSHTNQVKIDNLIPLNQLAKDVTALHARLTGGNLTILQTAIGTTWELEPNEKILFLEDCAILPYQLDRKLLHLQQAGMLRGLQAVLFGTFGKKNLVIEQVLKDFASQLAIPVFQTDQFGHEHFNYPMIYHAPTTIIKKEGKFSLLTQVNFS